MACYCADWCSGVVSCVDFRTPDLDDINECKRECHCSGKAYVCIDGSPCDSLGGCITGIGGVAQCHYFGAVRAVEPGSGRTFSGWLGFVAGACGFADQTCDQICTYVGLLPRCPAPFPRDSTEFPFGYVCYDYCFSGPYQAPRGSGCYFTPRGLPCCIGTSCRFLPPQTCTVLGGRWHEGGFYQENACSNPPATHPCNNVPCCPKEPFDCRTGPGCQLTTRERCTDILRRFVEPGLGGMGCHRPGACSIGSVVCDHPPACVGGGPKDDSAVTFRLIYHKPPRTKKWLEGSAEVISINPQRPFTVAGDTTDCAFAYSDVGAVKGAPGGDAFMQLSCSQNGGEIPRLHQGPVRFREDGNARFATAYRAA